VLEIPNNPQYFPEIPNNPTKKDKKIYIMSTFGEEREEPLPASCWQLAI
jgi:hypothetical protein